MGSVVGSCVGLVVGSVGAGVGACVGFFVGPTVGRFVSPAAVGDNVGCGVGILVGIFCFVIWHSLSLLSFVSHSQSELGSQNNSMLLDIPSVLSTLHSVPSPLQYPVILSHALLLSKHCKLSLDSLYACHVEL